MTILPVQEPAKSSKDLSPPIDLQLPSGNLIVCYGKWMKMDENGWKWMKMDENGWKLHIYRRITWDQPSIVPDGWFLSVQVQFGFNRRTKGKQHGDGKAVCENGRPRGQWSSEALKQWSSEAAKQWMVKRYLCWNWRVGTPNFQINRTRIGIYSLPTLDLPEPKWQKSTSPAQKKLDLDWGICDADTTTTELRTCSPYKITCIQWILTFPRLKP